MTFTTKSALAYIGGLSSPSKMPCHGYSIPASKCITGRKLHQVEGSICSKCYALKGRYGFDVVRNAMMRRWRALKKARWVEAMTTAITNVEKSGFFRWHDSGDLQGIWHLENIVRVAENTPHIRHWIPTREYTTVSQYLAWHGGFPPNLTVRLSSLMFDGPPPTGLAQRLGLTVSGASKDQYDCPAPHQGGECGACRKCWDPSHTSVMYKKH